MVQDAYLFIELLVIYALLVANLDLVTVIEFRVAASHHVCTAVLDACLIAWVFAICTASLCSFSTQKIQDLNHTAAGGDFMHRIESTTRFFVAVFF